MTKLSRTLSRSGTVMLLSRDVVLVTVGPERENLEEHAEEGKDTAR